MAVSAGQSRAECNKLNVFVMYVCRCKIFGNAPELEKIKSEVRGSR